MKIVKLSLLQNAEGFLREAIKKAVEAETSVPEWKFAVLHLVQALELTLKEMLAREHRWLIYKDVDKRSQTVGLDSAKSRLVDLGILSIAKNTLDDIKVAKEFRDKIVHHEVEFQHDELRLRFAALLAFLDSLWKHHLGRGIHNLVDRPLMQKLLAIEEHQRRLMAQANVEMTTKGIKPAAIWVCKACGCRAFVHGCGYDRCFVCGYAEETKECVVCGEDCFLNDGWVVGDEEDTLATFVCWGCDEKTRQ